MSAVAMITPDVVARVFNHLSSNRDSAANIPDRPDSGVHAVFAKDQHCLPNIILPSSGLVYVGLSQNLAQRNHFKAKHSGRDTLRRSIGAILKTRLHLTAKPRANGPSKTNYENFRFCGDGEPCLTRWMYSNLDYSIYLFDENVGCLKKKLIKKYKPPLSLTEWENPYKKKIEALRNTCKREAKRVWEKYHS